MSETSEPIAEETARFFEDLRAKFSSSDLGEARWYLLAVHLTFPNLLY